MNKLIAIVGPTGSGKSDLAVKLAKTFCGEIVNADSRQLLRYLDIGTAKQTPEDLAGVPSHLFDIITPETDFNLADFQRLAYSAFDEIQSRKRLPILVGGSGLYVWTVLEGWQIPKIAPDMNLRKELEGRAKAAGNEVLYKRLKLMDPEAASRIDPKNTRRIIRALETRIAGTSSSGDRPTKQEPAYRILVIGLTADREELYRRIDARVDKMIEMGLVEEVRALLDRGYAPDAAGFRSVGYKEVVSYLKGELNLRETVERIKVETHRLVRHQYNWFHLNDERIHWFDIGTEYLEKVKRLVCEFVKEADSNYGFY
ncbi:tRNA dimethylallyltransferase [Dehalogenimonas formicexedens]|uniref:tRNA dimethylallyltransferase n=1 Tax=Dehalogenimonas formicexedens TaxID=1839801 RepID=A0A1P8F6S9_9CHLR|nr:tRNA (adenosine(37)-N6)-dimethylallyltransferase MiaA [Dehalogenimonas formicexedens]APV44184.1 tRNA dimethylallyltransferase [Dehalogenimonas formicexedens]